MTATSLPSEILIMIFRSVHDIETIRNIRLTGAVGRDTFRKSDLFRTLALNNNRRHSANKVLCYIENDLLRYVRTLVLCSSSYTSPHREAVLTEDGDASFEHLSRMRLYDLNVWDELYDGLTHPEALTDGKRFVTSVKDYTNEDPEWSSPHGPSSDRYTIFIVYVVRLIARNPGGINIKIQIDHTDDEIYDTPGIRHNPELARRGGRGRITPRRYAQFRITLFVVAVSRALYNIVRFLTVRADETARVNDVAYSLRYIKEGDVRLFYSWPEHSKTGQFGWYNREEHGADEDTHCFGYRRLTGTEGDEGLKPIALYLEV